MKLLFDQNLSPRLVALLGNLYPDSSHVFLLHLHEKDDLTIWNYAKEHGYILVTKDADFNDLSLILGQPPKVIWVQRRNCKTTDIQALLRHHFDDIQSLERISERLSAFL